MTGLRRITSLEGLADSVASPGFSLLRPQRVVVAPSAPAPRLQALACPQREFFDPWLGGLHAKDGLHIAHDLACWFFTGLTVSGRGHLFLDEALLAVPEFMPDYWRRMVEDGAGADPAHEYELPTRVIDHPCLCVLGHGLHVYGHFLLEMLPRLQLARRILGPALPAHRILMDRQAPGWLLSILHGLYGCTDADFEWFDSSAEKLLLMRAIVPTLASTDGPFHPYAASLYADALRWAGPARLQAEGLFVSRALFSNPHSYGRRCLNEVELARIATREFGLAVVAPETFPWADQIRLFAGARVVVGEFGSALHSALFAPPGARVGALGFFNLAQSYIGALCGQRNAYLRTTPAEGARPGDPAGDYSVDPDLFRQFVTTLLQSDPRNGSAT